jgi:hypothetical protein
MDNNKIYVDQEKELTTITVAGKITADQIITALEGFYTESPTTNLLWDFSRVVFSKMTQEEIGKILFTAKAHAPARKSGRTAIVAPTDYEFGFARMYEIMAEVNQHPIDHRAFRLKDEAMKWLLGEDYPRLDSHDHPVKP